MKILVVTQPKENGLTYHRQTVPHTHLMNNYQGYEISTTYDISEATKEELSQYNIVTFLRLVDEKGRSEEIINKCKSAGCKTVIDIDDYWNLHPSHNLAVAYKEAKIPEQTIEGLKACDWVTTTTEHFADKIREFNKNVTVLPNSIDPNENQFKQSPTQSNRVRFGYISGVYHVQDAKMLYNGIKDVYKTVNSDKFQMCVGGFTPNQNYGFIEYIFTNEYKALKNPEYRAILSRNRQDLEDGFKNESYRRLWGKDVYNYATLYNDIDVALVPLVETAFNSYKSQLKIIEAGWFKKAVIVSNVMPYTIDCRKDNAILINQSKRADGWNTAMKSLILHPDRIKEYGERLHEVVKEKYVMDKVNTVRDQLYKRLCE